MVRRTCPPMARPAPTNCASSPPMMASNSATAGPAAAAEPLLDGAGAAGAAAAGGGEAAALPVSPCEAHANVHFGQRDELNETVHAASRTSNRSRRSATVSSRCRRFSIACWETCRGLCAARCWSPRSAPSEQRPLWVGLGFKCPLVNRRLVVALRSVPSSEQGARSGTVDALRL